jgi:succinate-semialdehyde dehydrogenase/glutarate-semialdehyde dehydrogenase
MAGVPTYRSVQLLIDGGWVDATDGRTLSVVNPGTGQAIGTVAHASTADLDKALAAAEKGRLAQGAAVGARQGSERRRPAAA